MNSLGNTQKNGARSLVLTFHRYKIWVKWKFKVFVAKLKPGSLLILQIGYAYIYDRVTTNRSIRLVIVNFENVDIVKASDGVYVLLDNDVTTSSPSASHVISPSSHVTASTPSLASSLVSGRSLSSNNLSGTSQTISSLEMDRVSLNKEHYGSDSFVQNWTSQKGPCDLQQRRWVCALGLSRVCHDIWFVDLCKPSGSWGLVDDCDLPFFLIRPNSRLIISFWDRTALHQVFKWRLILSSLLLCPLNLSRFLQNLPVQDPNVPSAFRYQINRNLYKEICCQFLLFVK